jgi:hypothetical protein
MMMVVVAESSIHRSFFGQRLCASSDDRGRCGNTSAGRWIYYCGYINAADPQTREDHFRFFRRPWAVIIQHRQWVIL